MNARLRSPHATAPRPKAGFWWGWAASALILAGCSAPGTRGVVARAAPSPAAARPSIVATLALDPVTDERPAGERRWYPDAARELHAAMEQNLAAWQGPRPEVRLHARLLRLDDPARAGRAGVLVGVSLRRPDGSVLWTAAIPGVAPLRMDGEAASPGAIDEAVEGAIVDFFHTLDERLAAVLSLGGGALPARPTQVSPSVFLVERVSRRRDLLETLYIEAASGAILRHEAGALPDRGHARPGDWLLSRRTVEGLTLSGEAYEGLVRALSGRYELRQLDDAYRVHFFGRR